MPKLNLKTKMDNKEFSDVSQYFEGAVLCSLTTKAWGNTKKINIEKLSKVSNKKLSDRIRASKTLIDKKALEVIHFHINKARNVIKAYSLPFPIDSIYLIPNEYIEVLSENLDETIELLEDAKDKFIVDYTEYIEEAKDELGEDWFDDSDYPPPDKMKDKFSITFRFMEISIPGEVKTVSPKLYAQEVEKFRSTLEQARNEAVIYLREGFVAELHDVISTLTEKNEDGKLKRVRSDSIDKIERFFEIFKSKDIFKDGELMKHIEQCRSVMVGLEASDFRSNENLRNVISEELKKVSEVVEKSITSVKRKISL